LEVTARLLTAAISRRLNLNLPKDRPLTGKFTRNFIALTLFLPLIGCASIGVRDSSLELQITPQPLMRGQKALAKVNAPLDAEKVVGTVLVFGSPELIFQKDTDAGLWYFYGTIPFSPWVKPGSYQIRVVVHEPGGKPHYTEMKVELK
jgi:hypothetical protein